MPLVNEAGATVNLTGGELAQTAGTTTSNGGTANIAPGSTWLVQGGAFANTGTLAPQIAGATDVGTVNLTVGSKFTAGATLAPTLSGYAPAAGTEFPVVTLNGGTVTGTFGAVTGGFSADYGKETASPPYVGVVYNGASGTAPPTSPPSTPARPTIGKVRGGAGKVTFAISCSAKASSCTSYAAKGTVTEHLKGRKLVAVTAAAKRRSKSKIALVGSCWGRGARGRPGTITLTLDRTGTKLLKKFHKLEVRVVVTSGGTVISKRTVTVTERKAKRKKTTRHHKK